MTFKLCFPFVTSSAEVTACKQCRRGFGKGRNSCPVGAREARWPSTILRRRKGSRSAGFHQRGQVLTPSHSGSGRAIVETSVREMSVPGSPPGRNARSIWPFRQGRRPRLWASLGKARLPADFVEKLGLRATAICFRGERSVRQSGSSRLMWRRPTPGRLRSSPVSGGFGRWRPTGTRPWLHLDHGGAIDRA